MVQVPVKQQLYLVTARGARLVIYITYNERPF